MKWTTHELIKLENTNNKIDFTINLLDNILDTDIIDMSDVKVTGDFEIYDAEEFVFYLNIRCTLILPCAITLKEVRYDLDLDVEEVFTTYRSDDSTQIEGITIDLLPIIWSNIILEKPMRVLSENAYDEADFENTEFEVEEKANAFASLKNYKQ